MTRAKKYAFHNLNDDRFTKGIALCPESNESVGIQ